MIKMKKNRGDRTNTSVYKHSLLLTNNITCITSTFGSISLCPKSTMLLAKTKLRNCFVVFPPPPMARLQPMPASHELLAPFDVAIRALRPNWMHPDVDLREEVKRLGWKVLEENGSESQASIWQKLNGIMQARGGVVDPSTSEISKGIFDELPPWKVCGHYVP